MTYASLRSIVDVDILQENIRRVNHCHRPHLALEEDQAFEDRVCGLGDGQLMRPPGII